ncbi:hypothetical protein [Yinghuangia soli]|uniref:Uncharacterized protein n=1 Tax=Yinghuangia soli TaxID=2908204 RepID=A0AA41TY08_9ACTN|nr:hypothetical protein [Yinghuangia soli]MCF2525645.1 hypothetical protein [Yinghuangia soli]
MTDSTDSTESTGSTSEPVRIRRTPPPELAAVAAQHPGGSVAQIDSTYVDDPDGYVPPEAIAGAWIVAEDGTLTGEFAVNPRHGPPQDDFTKLTEPDHWLGWLPGDPERAVLDGIVECLTSQAPGAVVDWLKVTGTPAFLTGGIPQADGGEADPTRRSVLVVRAAMAVPFALSVRAPERRREILWGVFSWVAVDLHRPEQRKDRTWLDLWTPLERAKELLDERVYSVGTPAEDPDGPLTG